jgi:hypothetical protein
VFIWISTKFTGVTASNLWLSAVHANDHHPFGFSALSWFRLADGCDTFWKIMADRWAVCIILSGRCFF